MTAATRTIVADPVLVLAEVICRLRHAGAQLPMDRESLTAAHGHVAGMLAALGLPAGGELSEADWLMLRCVAAPRS